MEIINTPTETEFQRAGLLAVLAAFSTDDDVDIVTRLSIKEATLKILNEHPVRDNLENKVRVIMR